MEESFLATRQPDTIVLYLQTTDRLSTGLVHKVHDDTAPHDAPSHLAYGGGQVLVLHVELKGVGNT